MTQEAAGGAEVARAQKALRTPDLEWAHDLVHGLANDVLRLTARIEELERDLHFLRRFTNQSTNQSGRP